MKSYFAYYLFELDYSTGRDIVQDDLKTSAAFLKNKIVLKKIQ